MSLAHPHRRHPAYCYCSELEHAQIPKRQQQDPLPFAEAMRVHCQSGSRCGRCLRPLEQLFRQQSCYIADP
ncbi:hypothetical protein NW813_02755 [Synechococcus sp. R55.6]|uniref:hypothetical protein n=1 Tax=unclassified Synechococcus TaxID=2626047 RepID=UPI0039C05DB6